jgi:Ca2+ transporting ATPase
MDIGKIEIKKDQLIELINTYQSRESYEELSLIEKHGGDGRIIQNILSSKNFGIEEHTCQIREKLFGSNKMKEYEASSICSFVIDAFGDFMLRVLIVAAIVQICIGVSPLSAHPNKDWIDGVSIIFAVTAVVVISSYTNYTKETKFKTLNDQSQFMTNCTIIRDGKTYEPSPNNILVGDLVKLKLGSIIHCDGI